MNGIKFNSDQNDNQYDNYIGLLNNHDPLYTTDYNNNNTTHLLNFQHISNDINEVNVGPYLKQLQCVIGELVESESVYLKSLCDIEEVSYHCDIFCCCLIELMCDVFLSEENSYCRGLIFLVAKWMPS